MAKDPEYFFLENGRTNFSWATAGTLLVQLSKEGDVSAERFDCYLDLLSTRDITHLLSVSQGPSVINSVQRKKAADIAKEKNIRIAVVLDSAFTRGLVTAFSWLGIPIKSYRPEELEKAIHDLAHPDVSKDQFLEMLARLEKRTHPLK